jgi:hypothetical protein
LEPIRNHHLSNVYLDNSLTETETAIDKTLPNEEELSISENTYSSDKQNNNGRINRKKVFLSFSFIYFGFEN